MASLTINFTVHHDPLLEEFIRMAEDCPVMARHAELLIQEDNFVSLQINDDFQITSNLTDTALELFYRAKGSST